MDREQELLILRKKIDAELCKIQEERFLEGTTKLCKRANEVVSTIRDKYVGKVVEISPIDKRYKNGYAKYYAIESIELDKKNVTVKKFPVKIEYSHIVVFEDCGNMNCSIGEQNKHYSTTSWFDFDYTGEAVDFDIRILLDEEIKMLVNNVCTKLKEKFFLK